MTARKLAAEFIGTAGLLLAIVGSGITTSADGAASAQLFQHALVVGAALAALIVTFGWISGAHFNPVVTLADTVFGGMPASRASGYIGAQLAGGIVGVLAANVLFDLPAVTVSETQRSGIALAASEVVATFGLLLVIFGVVRSGHAKAVPAAVGAWIAAAIYFTSSTSFANPAVTLARMFTDTYTGIAPDGVPAFVIAQILGAVAAIAVIGWLFRPAEEAAGAVVVPHGDAHNDTPTDAHADRTA